VTVRTDPLPALDNDILAFCRTTGHELLAVDYVETGREYTIRKADATRAQPAWAFVISNPGLSCSHRWGSRSAPR
jgi:hypothetical protein